MTRLISDSLWFRSIRPVVVVLCVVGVACSYDSALDEARCDDHSDCEPDGVCDDGWCVVGDLDSGVADTEPPDAPPPCQPQSDLEFCQSLQIQCGEVEAEDNCGEHRGVDCEKFDGFGCDEPAEVCGDDHQCGCIDLDDEESSQELCALVGAQCGSVDVNQLCPEWDDVDDIDCGDCPDDDCGKVAEHFCGCPCTIDGNCYDVAQSHDDAPCLICDPERSTTGFSVRSDGTECARGAICDDGQCVCDDEAGYTDCDGECVDTDDDFDHCGGCHQPCNSRQICEDGSCICDEEAGYTDCDGECVDTDDDFDHCGGCDQSCPDDPPNYECNAGLCACMPDCDDADCGPDGCGHRCGECQGCDVCDDGQCVGDHTQCPHGEACIDGSCECVPQCDTIECGHDGCGGSCGTCFGCQGCAAGVCIDDPTQCSSDETCQNGQCVCDPDCVYPSCGGSDGCGGTCGCIAGQECCGGTCCSNVCCDGECCAPGQSCNAEGECE